MKEIYGILMDGSLDEQGDETDAGLAISRCTGRWVCLAICGGMQTVVEARRTEVEACRSYECCV